MTNDKEIQKRFPANTSLEDLTFLNDKRINGELYALLQSLSFPTPQKDGVFIPRKTLPTQTDMCAKLGIKSPKTLRAHLQLLIATGYVIEQDDGYFLPNMEDVYLLIPLETLQFLNDTMKEHVIKIYIYLGQRFKFKENYVFTIEELAKHIGVKLGNNSRAYQTINNALIALVNNGLVNFVEFYDGQKPQKKLTHFSFEYKKRA